MAKKRSGSSKEKCESTSSVSKGCVSGKRNGICQGSPRSSLKATTRSAKRDLKSIRVPSQKSPADIDEEKSTRRRSSIGKKRNSSHQGLNESPSKKHKIDTLHQVHELKEEAAKTKELDKHSSLRGKRKKAGQSKQPHNDKAEETLKPQTDSIELMAEKHQLKQKSPLKHINVHEATPEDLQGSQRKHKIVSKKLKLDLVANVEEDFTAQNDAGVSSYGESSDEENVAWEEVDEAHVADRRLEIGDDKTEASTSHKQHSPCKKSVEISITVPGTKKGKKGWNQEDMMKYVNRAVTRFRKEVSINVHKVHLLTLVARGIFRNSVCNDPVHQAVLLSHVPNDFVSGNKRKWDVAQLSNFLKWFQSEFTNTDDVGTGEKEADEQISKVQNLSEVLVIVLRALGFLARLVYSMQPMSTKGNLENKLSLKTSKKNTLKESKTTVKNTSEEILKTPTQPRKQKAAIKKELVKTENEVITPSSKPVKKTPEESSKIPTQPKKRKAATKKKVVKTENEITTPSSTPVKNTSEDILKTSTQPRKQKAAMKKEIVKSENEVTTPSRKPVIYSSDNKCGSGKLYEEKVQKSKKSESSANCAVKTPTRRTHQVDKVIAEDMDHAGSGKKNMTKNKRPLRKRKKVDYSLCGTDDRSDADEERNDESSDNEESSEEIYVVRENLKTRSKTPLARKKKSTGSDDSLPSGNSSQSVVDLVDDDSDFEVTSKPLVRRRTSAGSSERKKKGFKMVNSDESDESVKCLGYVSNEQDSNWWAEVYLPVDKKWICLHLESSSINHPELCETQATQPLVYVVAFDNKNSIKDVTNRYASSWMSKTRKLRIDSDWWENTLRPYRSKNKKMTEMEDSHLEDQLLDKPLPTSITEYKNHPLYALKRHLLKFEAIYPETATILGYCRSEAVYSRECVHTLHTREKWLNEALVVTQGENAYKIVKGRAKRNQPIHERDSVTTDLFGRWQTETYKPPPAKDGKVPRNEYGNVELFQPCMLPPGTKHIQVNGILRVAKKLGIDCAQAVVGFDFHCGFSHPVIDGVVVCEEFERVLLDAWKEEEEQAEKRKAEKREKRMLANWRLLTRSLLIRERLRKRYDTEETNMAETSSNCEEEMTTDTSIAWPLNRQEGKSSVASDGHCHVFPASGHRQDSVTGEWTKSCSCGLTLPFEKM